MRRRSGCVAWKLSARAVAGARSLTVGLVLVQVVLRWRRRLAGLVVTMFGLPGLGGRIIAPITTEHGEVFLFIEGKTELGFALLSCPAGTCVPDQWLLL